MCKVANNLIAKKYVQMHNAFDWFGSSEQGKLEQLHKILRFLSHAPGNCVIYEGRSALTEKRVYDIKMRTHKLIRIQLLALNCHPVHQAA